MVNSGFRNRTISILQSDFYSTQGPILGDMKSSAWVNFGGSLKHCRIFQSTLIFAIGLKRFFHRVCHNPPIARRCCYIQVKLLELLHLLDEATPATTLRSKEIEYCVLPPCILWFATMPTLASTKTQEGMQHNLERPRPSPWQPVVLFGMDSSKQIPYLLQINSPHVTNIPRKIEISNF